MSDTPLLTRRVSDRIMLANADASPYFYEHNRKYCAQTDDAVVAIDPPGGSLNLDMKGTPFQWIAAADFCAKRWHVELPRSGWTRHNMPVTEEILHMPAFVPSYWNSSATGLSVSLRFADQLLVDVAADSEGPLIPPADWAGQPTIEKCPRSAAMLQDLGRQVQAGAGESILFLEERIRGILRMWMVERRKLEPRPPKHCRFTAQGMALLKSTLQARCLDNPTLAELAAVVGMGVDPFRRAFRAAFKQTPHAYLLELRLSLVREALARDEHTPLHVLAPACGFANAPHLVRSFKKRYGWTPQKFREWTVAPRRK